MRLPSGETAIPWLASIPLISPTTLLVAGSMMLILSPAELVCRMRSCAAGAEKDTVHRKIPVKAARPPRSTWLDVIVISHVRRHPPRRVPGGKSVQKTTLCVGAYPCSENRYSLFRDMRRRPLLCGCSRYEFFQRLPGRVGLRGELLAAAMVGIAARLLRQRMLDQRALHVAGHRHPLHQLEVLARLLLVPGGSSGRERHQVERRVVDRMAHDAAGVALALGQKDGLDLGLEEFVVELGARAGRRPLALRRPRPSGRRQGQTRREHGAGRGGPGDRLHRYLPEITCVKGEILCLRRSRGQVGSGR